MFLNDKMILNVNVQTINFIIPCFAKLQSNEIQTIIREKLKLQYAQMIFNKIERTFNETFAQ